MRALGAGDAGDADPRKRLAVTSGALVALTALELDDLDLAVATLVFHRGGPAQTSTIAKEELWGTHYNFAQYFFVKSWEMKVGAKGIF